MSWAQSSSRLLASTFTHYLQQSEQTGAITLSFVTPRLLYDVTCATPSQTFPLIICLDLTRPCPASPSALPDCAATSILALEGLPVLSIHCTRGDKGRLITTDHLAMQATRCQVHFRALPSSPARSSLGLPPSPHRHSAQAPACASETCAMPAWQADDAGEATRSKASISVCKFTETFSAQFSGVCNGIRGQFTTSFNDAE